MEELIRKISESIGVDESVATAAVGHVLAFLQKELPEGPVSELVAKLPGSQEAIAAAETAPARFWKRPKARSAMWRWLARRTSPRFP